MLLIAVAAAAFSSPLFLLHPLPLSLLLQLLKNANTILSLWAVQNQATGWVWPVGGSLPILVVEVGEPVGS